MLFLGKVCTVEKCSRIARQMRLMKSALYVPQHEPVAKTFEDAKVMVLEEIESLYSGVYNIVRFHMMCVRWVPRQLTEESKYYSASVTWNVTTASGVPRGWGGFKLPPPPFQIPKF
jgi:hypothetical protein